MADNNSVIFPRKLLRRFLTMYRELPCLWDRSCAAYKQKRKRHEAISKLTDLVQEHDPGATRVHVLRKIESLRACVRREYKRVQDSRRRAANPDELYTPHLWYYDMLSFVFGDDGASYKPKECSPDRNEESDDCANDVSEEEASHFEPPVESYAEYNANNSMIDLPRNSPMSKRYHFEDETTKSGKRLCTEIEDEYDAIGINVAAKLRNLHPNMRIVTEKLINDVLYQAQMNSLNSSSVISTTDPFKQIII
ncbi:unnamed protein product, partial [Iphiclides podalirius]